MTIYDLLKNSSPSMAKHFNDCEQGVKTNKEDITSLKTRVTTLEENGGSGGTPTVYEPCCKIIYNQTDFSKATKMINNVSYEAYGQQISLSESSLGTFKHSESFTPHCEQVFSVEGQSQTYHTIPVLHSDTDIFLNPDLMAVAIIRNYTNSDNNPTLVSYQIIISKKMFEYLGEEDKGNFSFFEFYV